MALPVSEKKLTGVCREIDLDFVDTSTGNFLSLWVVSHCGSETATLLRASG